LEQALSFLVVEEKMVRSRNVKPSCCVAIAATLILGCAAFAQGTMIFDQSSSTTNNTGEFLANIQASQPIGQSFTPSLDGVGFVRLYVSDRNTDGVGTTIFVNLISGSITGSVISATAPVFVPDGFHGFTDFFFPGNAAVTPGSTYYLRPVVQSGEDYGVGYDSRFVYPSGNAFFNGVGDTFYDLWFQEGIVPEPSVTALLVVGAGVLAYAQRKRK
jgi:hypothetical protein